MIRQSVGPVLRSGRGVRVPRIASSSRLIHTTVVRQRQDRLPPGHVRARRVSRPVPIPPAGGGMGGQLPIEDSMPYRPDIGTRRDVSMPNDPKGVLGVGHGVRELLANDTLVIVRQLEMLNVFMGYEQANRYAIYTPEGHLVGFLAEEDRSLLSTMSRQFLHTHRPFKATIMNPAGEPILWIRRPFAFINSRMYVHAAEGDDGRLVGEAQQQWHPWRRRYNVFQTRGEETFSQFARIDSGFLAWDFWLKDRDDRLVASINRNFRGLGRELFTDTGQYVIRFDSAGTELALPPGSEVGLQGQTLILPDEGKGGLTLDQRAMTLATAVSIDFDYFSRHSGSGGFGLPFMMWGGGDGSSDATTTRGAGQLPESMPGGAAGAAGMGAAGAMGRGGNGEASDEEMYGAASQPGAEGSLPRNIDGEEARGRGYNEELGWGEDGWESENQEVMQDPYQQESDGGWFDGGGGDWGGGGDGGGGW